MVIDNPLELYEIVCRIGTFIQLYTWDRDDARFYRFTPNDLLSCLRVCRAWHAALAPLLWTVYSDLEMERRKVPIEAIVAHSQHIRFFEYDNNVSRGPLLPTNLRELRLNGISSFESCADYILANPQLTALDWTLRSEHQTDPLQCLAIQTALESLSHLQHLRLGNWRVYDPVQFSGLIRKTPGLKELALVQMEGLGHLEGCPLMYNVTRLYLQCLWGNVNPGLSDVLRFCPNLQSLTLFNFNDCPMATITRNLRECSLETFELNGFKQRAFEYEDAFYNTFDNSRAGNKDAKPIDQGEYIEGETPLDQEKNEHMDPKQGSEDKTLIINKAMYLRGNEGNAALLSSRHMHTDYGKYPYQDPELMATLTKQGWSRHRIYSHRWLGHVSSCHANILRRKLFARLGCMPSVRKVSLNDVVYSRAKMS
ncbi:hypothetical protein BGZ93_000755 [Podila epicladia]|nr:hypothetical protein BGZ92_002117 [Podila epicladia]KAG0085287.1 hypothetical protein BGZ93_000755 [Podila epicladia]